MLDANQVKSTLQKEGVDFKHCKAGRPGEVMVVSNCYSLGFTERELDIISYYYKIEHNCSKVVFLKGVSI